MYTMPSIGPATTSVVSFESMFWATANLVLVLQIAIVQSESASSEKTIPEGGSTWARLRLSVLRAKSRLRIGRADRRIAPSRLQC